MGPHGRMMRKTLNWRIDATGTNLSTGRYRAQCCIVAGNIPKADGRQRPLAVAALEDKIVQRATVAVMNAIYEEDFLGFLVWVSTQSAASMMRWMH